MCQRKFKTADQLRRHEAISDLHRQKVAEAKARELADIKAEMKVYTYTQHTHTHTGTQARKLADMNAEMQVDEKREF